MRLVKKPIPPTKRWQRRHANGLPGLDPRVRLHPAAIDPKLPLAAHLFNPALRQMREAFAQETVETLIALIRRHGDHLNPAHASALPAQRPAIRAKMERMTEPPI